MERAVYICVPERKGVVPTNSGRTTYYKTTAVAIYNLTADTALTFPIEHPAITTLANFWTWDGVAPLVITGPAYQECACKNCTLESLAEVELITKIYQERYEELVAANRAAAVLLSCLQP
jgi:hypothetical protein